MCNGMAMPRRKDIRYYKEYYNLGRSKIDLNFNLNYKHTFNASTAIWLKSEENEESIIRMLKRLGEKYKKVIKDYLNPEKSIIIWDIPSSIGNPNRFMVVVDIAALMNEEMTKAKLVDYAETLVPIFESFIQELNANFILPTTPMVSAKKKEKK